MACAPQERRQSAPLVLGAEDGFIVAAAANFNTARQRDCKRAVGVPNLPPVRTSESKSSDISNNLQAKRFTRAEDGFAKRSLVLVLLNGVVKPQLHRSCVQIHCSVVVLQRPGEAHQEAVSNRGAKRSENACRLECSKTRRHQRKHVPTMHNTDKNMHKHSESRLKMHFSE